MTKPAIRFALNHMSAPKLKLDQFFDLAKSLGMTGVEIRNDLAGNAILDGAGPQTVREYAAARGITIISINALQRFNEWNAAREAEARELIAYAAACGAKALVLVPKNDGTGCVDGERQANLLTALKALRPMLEEAGVAGFVEPLGFESCSLRLKSEAADAIHTLNAASTFWLVHDTFHHHLAGEAEMFSALTGLVHISGVSDRDVSVANMRDSHRVLVDGHDRLDNAGQIATLLKSRYAGSFSFEPFADSVHDARDIAGSLRQSMNLITAGVKELVS